MIARILLVANEATWAADSVQSLGAEGVVCDRSATLLGGLNAFSSAKYHLVLMEISASDAHGMTLLRAICGLSNVPVIVVSPEDTAEARIEVLDAGADYFLPSPPPLEAVMAHVRAVFRRSGQKIENSAGFVFPSPNIRGDFIESSVANDGEPASSQRLPLVCGDLVLDPLDRSVKIPGAETSLTKSEYQVLRLLMINEGRVVLTEQILETLHGSDARPFTRVVPVYVSRIRSKLRELTGDETIVNVRGRGWLFRAPTLNTVTGMT